MILDILAAKHALRVVPQHCKRASYRSAYGAPVRGNFQKIYGRNFE